MDHYKRLCNHINTVIDVHCGDLICESCGLIVNQYYVDDDKLYETKSFSYHPLMDTLKDLLDKIHVSKNCVQHILNYHKVHYKPSDQKGLIFSIYKILNEILGYTVSLQDLCNTTGFSKEDIFSVQKSNENVSLETSEMVEKYSSLLGVDYKNVSLIKEKIKNHPLTGHTPSTIVSANLYLHCKKIGKKVSIKKISQLTSVSSISIQRYIKKYDSSQW